MFVFKFFYLRCLNMAVEIFLLSLDSQQMSSSSSNLSERLANLGAALVEH